MLRNLGSKNRQYSLNEFALTDAYEDYLHDRQLREKERHKQRALAAAEAEELAQQKAFQEFQEEKHQKILAHEAKDQDRGAEDVADQDIVFQNNLEKLREKLSEKLRDQQEEKELKKDEAFLKKTEKPPKKSTDWNVNSSSNISLKPYRKDTTQFHFFKNKDQAKTQHNKQAHQARVGARDSLSDRSARIYESARQARLEHLAKSQKEDHLKTQSDPLTGKTFTKASGR